VDASKGTRRLVMAIGALGAAILTMVVLITTAAASLSSDLDIGLPVISGPYSIDLAIAKPSRIAAMGSLLGDATARDITKRATPVRSTSSAYSSPASTSRSDVVSTDWKKTRASWYGPGFYGNTMAGGGVLTPDSMVVAHRTLPFGTKIQIEYGGRTCTAVVQDRGPYIDGREFDLGPGTAKALGFSGVQTISYRIIGR